MSDTLKIKVSLADRVYPLTIRRSEEEHVRQAAKQIGEMLKKYGEGYAVRDKQDLLAMCALQLASRLEKNNRDHLIDGRAVSEVLGALELKLEEANKH